MTKEQAENAEKRFHTINFDEIELFHRLSFQSNESNNRLLQDGLWPVLLYKGTT